MTTVEIIVGGMLTICGASERATARIVDRLSLRNPQYTERAMLGLPLEGFDSRLSFAKEYPNFTVVPRGCVRDVKEILLNCDHQIKFVDKRSLGTPLNLPDPKFTPRDYQQEAIEAIVKHTQGNVGLPCGTGKTKLAILGIHRLNTSTLVIVPTKEIMDQWCEDVQTIFGLKAGRLGDGEKNIEPITIAILNSLDRLEDPSCLNNFGAIFHDECHRSCAKTNQRVLSYIPAKYRIGLTATKMREDGLEKLIDWTFGGDIFVREIPEMVSRGWLMMPEIQVVETKLEFEYYGPDKYKLEKLAQTIINDSDRLKTIKRIVSEQAQCKEKSVIVLANRKEYCHTIKDALEADGFKPVVITSDTPKKPRKLGMQQMREGKRNILIATSLADEGLDIPRLSDIVLAYPEKARSRTIQRIGRIMRPINGKFPIVWDIVDSLIPTLDRRWDDRRRIYKKIGLMY